MTPEEKEEIRLDLIGYITGTVDEWLRLADFETTREGQAKQYRISWEWEYPTDGAMIANVQETRYNEPVARFGVQIDVETLPDLPPIGPENDLGVFGIDDRAASDAYPCGECLTDPTEDLAPWCDCLADETCAGPCKRRAHSPERCPNRPQEERDEFSAPPGGFTGIVNEPGIEIVEWVTATFLDCLAGDHIRLGTEETDVIRSSSGIWHADTSDAWRPKAWRHTELRMEVTAIPGFNQYKKHNTPVDILMTPERKAVHVLNQAFPGSAVISSDVD